MYEWLVHEAKQVRWRKFFLFQRDTQDEALTAVEQRFGPLPKDYVRFVQQFGESRLFRHLRRGSYNMAVFSRPQMHEGKNDELLLEVGFFINGGYAHFRKRKAALECELGVFEGDGLQVRKTAGSFDEWLKKRFESAKKLYKKSDWKRIVEGASPFTSDELKLVEAIKLFSFERLGTAGNGNVQIRVFNGSELRLKYLTVGAKASGRLDGTVYLDVSDVGPGETQIVEHDCYKSIVAADKIELFRKPPPEPEERGMYYEFGAPEWMEIASRMES